jgi:hypothetical protein
MRIYFSDFFNISSNALEEYGAFDISLISDLPLFIDPFLLFNSEKAEYKQLHDEMIEYLEFLRDKSIGQALDDGTMKAWYIFKEVKQNWLGYSLSGNEGRGLGPDFAHALHDNFNTVFANFGDEDVEESPHLEKLTLVGTGVGRDNVSDFTTNLIKKYLLEYTQKFALANIDGSLLRKFAVKRAEFNYQTETWVSKTYVLPSFQGEYVLLTPRDILTKDELWISQRDLFRNYDDIVDSIPNDQLRAQINNYFGNVLSDIQRPKRKSKKPGKRQRSETPPEPTKEERAEAVWKAIGHFPLIIDYYIKSKEEHGDEATEQAQTNVEQVAQIFIERVTKLVELLVAHSQFYAEPSDSYKAALKRVQYLKDVIENNDGWRIFYLNGLQIKREKDLQIMYRLTWFASSFDVNSEANSGRGPVDYAISKGSANKALVEFKLASNSKLAKNLKHQTPAYQAAHRTRKSIKVVLYFSAAELHKVKRVLEDLKLQNNPSVVLIDARSDNKQSASNITD